MIAASNPQAKRNHVCDFGEIREGFSSRDPDASLATSFIAPMSNDLLDQMTCGELVQFIRAAKLPDRFCPNLDRRLPYYDRPVLTRLAHLTFIAASPATLPES